MQAASLSKIPVVISNETTWLITLEDKKNPHPENI
jgi:hypothetical protein